MKLLLKLGMNSRHTQFVLIMTACLLSSCSNSSTQNGTPSEDGDSTEQGLFIDSAVEGLNFDTGTQSGQTDNEGRFRYRTGEMIVFSIGELILPPTTANNVLTPIDLGISSDNPEATTTNIARLLQSLDVDGDPDNGITIPETAATIATPINFDVPIEVFASDIDVINLVANSGSVNGVLISAEVAREHLLSSIAALNANESSGLSEIVGYWNDSATGDFIAIESTGAIRFYDAQPDQSCHSVRQGMVSALDTSLYLVSTDNGESQQLVITRTDDRLNILFVGTLILVVDKTESDLVLCQE